jgi:hypothetical protein
MSFRRFGIHTPERSKPFLSKEGLVYKLHAVQVETLKRVRWEGLPAVKRNALIDLEKEVSQNGIDELLCAIGHDDGNLSLFYCHCHVIFTEQTDSADQKYAGTLAGLRRTWLSLVKQKTVQ